MDCGVVRVRSLILRVMVGNLSIWERLRFVTAPVLLELKIGFLLWVVVNIFYNALICFAIKVVNRNSLANLR